MSVVLCIVLLILAWGGPAERIRGGSAGMVAAIFGSWALAVLGCAFALVVLERGWP